MGLFKVVKGVGNSFKAKKVGGGGFKKPSKKDLLDFLDKNIKKTSDIKKDIIGKNVEQTMKEVAFIVPAGVAVTQTLKKKNKKPSTMSKKFKNPRSPKKSN